MEVQVIRPPGTDRPMWLVLDDAALPIAPLTTFLRYLDHRERSPNTIRAYAHHLMLFWTFLRDADRPWTAIGLTELADFVAWLRQPRAGHVTRAPQEARRTASTINAILAAVAAFYTFQERLGAVTAPPFTEQRRAGPRPYKPFLHHVAKRRTVASRQLALTVPRRFPTTLTADQGPGSSPPATARATASSSACSTRRGCASGKRSGCATPISSAGTTRSASSRATTPTARARRPVTPSWSMSPQP